MEKDQSTKHARSKGASNGELKGDENGRSHFEKFSGHKSADYGSGGPKAAGPGKKAPGTGE